MSLAKATAREPEVRLAKTAVARVLVVDDEPTLLRGVARMLSAGGMDVLRAEDAATALQILDRERVDVALVDQMMPRMSGLQLLEIMGRSHPGVAVIMMTAYGDVELAVKSVQAGAYDFLEKPFRSNDEVMLTISKAAERQRLVTRTAMLERKLEQEQKQAFGELIGNTPSMQEVYRVAMGVAPTQSTVLILGESGTGKELTAQAIHDHSDRANRPFVPVNCSAIPENLVESELFGHVKGAFTGANTSREGLFEAANHGTIFLDEVGDLPLLAQVKLLRTLQEGEVKRVGSNETSQVNVRVLAATNVDLRKKIAAGTFREDLYYRLNVVSIELPPLRERRDDIPILAHHFLRVYSKRQGRNISKISHEAMNLLRADHWPGNVRELGNAVEYAFVFCKGDTLGVEDLPSARRSIPPLTVAPGPDTGDASLKLPEALLSLPYREAKQRAVEAFDGAYFTAILQRTDGNISQAAREAGLDRSNFRRASKRWILK